MICALRAGRLLGIVAAAFLFAAPSAQAAFHLMKVSEVFPGTAANHDTAFIELQMFEGGQNLVMGHKVDYYTASGSLLGSYTIEGNVPNGENNRKILIGDTAVQGQTPDFTYPTLGDALFFAASGGAVCFPDAQPVDCVSWGNFTGQASIPGATGTPAPAIPDGQSLTRSTAPGCPNLLEAADDTDNSSADFALGAPNPQNNSVVPPTACGGNGNDTTAPKVTIDKLKLKGDVAKVKFSADEPNVDFECKLDKKPYKSCTSPKKFKNLDDGTHKVKVRGTDAAGNRGKAAKKKFEIG